MRKLTYYVATSFDGFVARPNGGLGDFSFEGEHVADLLELYPETIPTHLRSDIEVSHENKQFDTVLMGRHTYEVGQAFGITSPYQHLKQFLFSKSLAVSPDENVSLVSENAVKFVRSLKSDDGLGIWLCGGPVLASALINEVDDIVVKVNPFLMGAGKPLFAGEFGKRKLELVNRRDYANGFALVHFKLL